MGTSVEASRVEPSAEPTVRVVSADEIIIPPRIRVDLGDLAQMKESIARHGVLHLPVVAYDLRLVSGERVVEACRQLGTQVTPPSAVRSWDCIRAIQAGSKSCSTVPPGFSLTGQQAAR